MNSKRLFLLVFALGLLLLTVACSAGETSPPPDSGDEVGVVYRTPT